MRIDTPDDCPPLEPSVDSAEYRASVEWLARHNADVLARDESRGKSRQERQAKLQRDTSRRPAGLLGGFDEKEGS